MHFEYKKIQSLVLVVTSFVISRLMFFFFNDPEGPNLLIVTGATVILYLFSLLTYSLLPFENPKKLLLVIIIQILVTTVLYFCLK